MSGTLPDDLVAQAAERGWELSNEFHDDYGSDETYHSYFFNTGDDRYQINIVDRDTIADMPVNNVFVESEPVELDSVDQYEELYEAVKDEHIDVHIPHTDWVLAANHVDSPLDSHVTPEPEYVQRFVDNKDDIDRLVIQLQGNYRLGDESLDDVEADIDRMDELYDDHL